jgi:hypothetical protein
MATGCSNTRHFLHGWNIRMRGNPVAGSDPACLEALCTPCTSTYASDVVHPIDPQSLQGSDTQESTNSDVDNLWTDFSFLDTDSSENPNPVTSGDWVGHHSYTALTPVATWQQLVHRLRMHP